MSKRMLINASHEEESRVAIVVDDYLQELDIESAQKVQTKSNIYKGTITKIEPSLPNLSHDIEASVPAFTAYADAAPDLVSTIATTTTISNSISEKPFCLRMSLSLHEMNSCPAPTG